MRRFCELSAALRLHFITCYVIAFPDLLNTYAKDTEAT